jgi:chromosome segregation ATPase
MCDYSREEIETLKNENKVLRCENSEWKEKYADLHLNTVKMADDYERIERLLKESKKKHCDLANENTRLQSANQMLESQLAEADRRVKEYQAKLKPIEPIKTALFENTTKEDIKAEHDRMDKLIEQNAQLVRKNNENTAKISKLENRIKEWEKYYVESDLQVLEQKNGDLEADNSSLCAQLKDLQAKHDEAMKTNNDYLIRIRALEDRYSKDCIKINQLNVTIDTLVDKHSKLRELHGLV